MWWKLYEINLWLCKYSSDFTLNDSLFGAVNLTKNTDSDKYKYFWYGIGFDVNGILLSDGSGFGKNVIIIGTDMISSAHIDNRKKRYLDSCKGPTQGLDITTLIADK